MKSLPEAVQAAFPVAVAPSTAAHHHPDRPWWQHFRFGAQKEELVRVADGLRVSLNEWGTIFLSLPSIDPPPILTQGRTLLDILAEVDARWPLPHPGFRAGQVWAAEDGESLCLLRFSSPHALAPGAGTSVAWWSTEGRHLLGVQYPYLMADPACPHLAPWSPA